MKHFPCKWKHLTLFSEMPMVLGKTNTSGLSLELQRKIRSSISTQRNKNLPKLSQEEKLNKREIQGQGGLWWNLQAEEFWLTSCYVPRACWPTSKQGHPGSSPDDGSKASYPAWALSCVQFSNLVLIRVFHCWGYIVSRTAPSKRSHFLLSQGT